MGNCVVWCMLHYQAQMLYSCNPKIISEQILSFQKKDVHLQLKPKTESRQNFITSIYCINCTEELWSCSSTLEIKMYHKFIEEFKSCNKRTTQSEAMWLKHNSMQCDWNTTVCNVTETQQCAMWLKHNSMQCDWNTTVCNAV